jgi:hypothetical protein
LLHGLVSGTVTKPASRRKNLAAPIFMPITFGTLTPGRVGGATVVVVGDVVVVVVVARAAR